MYIFKKMVKVSKIKFINCINLNPAYFAPRYNINEQVYDCLNTNFKLILQITNVINNAFNDNHIIRD